MFLAKKLIAALVLPPTGLVLLALFGLWLTRRHPRTGRGLSAFALLTLLALSMPPVAEGLVRSLEVHPPISAADLGKVQAIVVLGGGNYHDAPEYGGDTVSRWTLERVRYGVHLQRRTGLPLLVTGGAPFGGRPEGETMKEAAERDFGGKVKWVEAASADTAENALYSARLLKADGVRRVAIVSQVWHLPRAIALFEAQGIDAIAAPIGFATRAPSDFARLLPSAGALDGSSMALREWLGRFVARLTTR